MRVLWTVNLIPGELAQALHLKSTVLGGWVEAMSSQIRKIPGMELAIACKTDEKIQIDTMVNGIHYFDLAFESVSELEQKCSAIIEKFQPNLIHVEGTEFVHAEVMLRKAKEYQIPNVVSLQGILNGQYRYQCGQLPMEDMMFSKSMTNMCAAWLLLLRKRLWYQKRMKTEYETLRLADNFLGRTTWDQAHAYAINPKAKYYACPRVLRQPFYEKEWEIQMVERHSIYVGNGYFALKGLHFMLMALPQLIREYPDVKLYVAGYPPYQETDKRAFWKRGYGSYLKKLVKDLDLESYVVFTGPLSAEQVAERLRRTHVYVLCSTVENSPNTLGEAMLLGTPCVAAYVGGVSDMAVDGKDALFFRNDDSKLLAWNIKKIFDRDELALELSQNARKHAARTHSPEQNAKLLLNAYDSILEGKE